MSGYFSYLMFKVVQNVGFYTHSRPESGWTFLMNDCLDDLPHHQWELQFLGLSKVNRLSQTSFTCWIHYLGSMTEPLDFSVLGNEVSFLSNDLAQSHWCYFCTNSVREKKNWRRWGSNKERKITMYFNNVDPEQELPDGKANSTKTRESQGFLLPRFCLTLLKLYPCISHLIFWLALLILLVCGWLLIMCPLLFHSLASERVFQYPLQKMTQLYHFPGTSLQFLAFVTLPCFSHFLNSTSLIILLSCQSLICCLLSGSFHCSQIGDCEGS